jgi:hypothetical protein
MDLRGGEERSAPRSRRRRCLCSSWRPVSGWSEGGGVGRSGPGRLSESGHTAWGYGGTAPNPTAGGPGGISRSNSPARPLTRRATSNDRGGILRNPTSAVSGGSEKGQIRLNFENGFILR